MSAEKRTLSSYQGEKNWPFQYIDLIKDAILKGEDLNIKNASGRTLLQQTAWDNNTICAELLLKNGARPNIQDQNNGQTALHLAGITQQATPSHPMIQLLLQCGASALIRDNNKKLPSETAVEENKATLQAAEKKQRELPLREILQIRTINQAGRQSGNIFSLPSVNSEEPRPALPSEVTHNILFQLALLLGFDSAASTVIVRFISSDKHVFTSQGIEKPPGITSFVEAIAEEEDKQKKVLKFL